MRAAVGEIRVEHPEVVGMFSDVNTAGDIEIRAADELGVPFGPVLKTVKREQ